jgi:hypothetical protein
MINFELVNRQINRSHKDLRENVETHNRQASLRQSSAQPGKRALKKVEV